MIFLRPGDYVLHPNEHNGINWGLGQVQSVDGRRITCNFEHRGKVSIDGSVIDLVPVDPENYR